MTVIRLTRGHRFRRQLLAKLPAQAAGKDSGASGCLVIMAIVTSLSEPQLRRVFKLLPSFRMLALLDYFQAIVVVVVQLIRAEATLGSPQHQVLKGEDLPHPEQVDAVVIAIEPRHVAQRACLFGGKRGASGCLVDFLAQ